MNDMSLKAKIRNIASEKNGLYGMTGSSEAKKVLLGNLEPENLGVQYFVSRQEVADRLILSLKQIDWR